LYIIYLYKDLLINIFLLYNIFNKYNYCKLQKRLSKAHGTPREC